MSSLIVNTETMNRVVTAVTRLPQHKVLSYFGTDKPDEIGEMLYHLNQSVYNGVDAGCYLRRKRHTFEHEVRIYNDCELLKACQCLIYQCCEGELIKDKLFILLEHLVSVLQHDIIIRMPEYQSATWNI